MFNIEAIELGVARFNRLDEIHDVYKIQHTRRHRGSFIIKGLLLIIELIEPNGGRYYHDHYYYHRISINCTVRPQSPEWKKTKQNTFSCLLLDHQVTNQHSNAPSNQHLLNARHDLGSYIYYIYNVIV